MAGAYLGVGRPLTQAGLLDFAQHHQPEGNEARQAVILLILAGSVSGVVPESGPGRRVNLVHVVKQKLNKTAN